MTTSQHTHSPLLPRPLRLANGAQQIISTPTNDVFSSTPPPSSFRNPKRFSLATSSPSTSATTPRRQSSISYLPPDATEGQRRGTLPRRNSWGTLNEGIVPREGVNEESWARDRVSDGSLLATSTSVPGTPAPRERPPLILTEKHADLLRFIAQKESKCLELRSQLAVHEAELLQLKRKWERIVNRGLERDSNPDSTASNDPAGSSVISSPAVLGGFKEGVQEMSRLLAASFSMADPKPAAALRAKPSSIPASQLQPKPRPPSLSPSARKSHTARESDSSISTYATKSTARFSQSSVSSFGEEAGTEFVSGSPKDFCEAQEEDGESSDNGQVLMVRDTGATPTMSPNPEFHKQKDKKHRLRHAPPRLLRDTHSQGNAVEVAKMQPNPSAKGGTWTSSSSIQTTKVHRRKSRDTVAQLDLQHLDFSTLSPSVLLSPPKREASSTSSPRSGSPSMSPSDEMRMETRSDSRGIRSNSSGNNVGGFPPASSIPGLGTLATGMVSPPVSSWMDSVGKTLGQIQRSSTFTKSQKRASHLFADVSQSIASVLTSPSASTYGSTTGTPSNSKSTSPPPYTPIAPISSPTSLLDDDDDTLKFNGTLLTPAQTLKRTPPGAGPVMNSVDIPRAASGPVKQIDDDDEEWDW